MTLKKLNTAMKEEIRMMKEKNRRIEEEEKLNKGMKVKIDTKEETRLTNPERQMKHENRLSLFLQSFICRCLHPQSTFIHQLNRSNYLAGIK